MLVLYTKFLIDEQKNIWRDYIYWFRDNSGPMCDFDVRLYHYVITRNKLVSQGNYTSLADFQVWTQEFDY